MDKEKPYNNINNMTSNKGSLRFLCRKLIDLIVIEEIITANKQLGAIESLLIEKVLVIYKLPKEDKAMDILVIGLPDIFNLAKNKQEITVNDNIQRSLRALFS